MAAPEGMEFPEDDPLSKGMSAVTTLKQILAEEEEEDEEEEEESSGSDVSGESSSNNGGLNKPHKGNDSRWEAIRAVRRRDGDLGINHFRLLKKLGSGDIGCVYLSELVGGRCSFAVKVMDKAVLASRKKLPRSQTEKEILRGLDHPFLPTLYAHFDTDKFSFLVMEFCPGGDLHALRQRQQGKCFPEHAARYIDRL